MLYLSSDLCKSDPALFEADLKRKLLRLRLQSYMFNGEMQAR